MKKYILALLLILGGWSSSFAQTPMEFSDKLADITDSLYEHGSRWGEGFKDANSSGNWSVLTPSRKRMETLIKENIQKVQAMKDINNSKPMRMAMIEFLQYELKLVSEAFMPLEKFTASTTDDTKKLAYEKLQTLAAEEETYLGKVKKEQEIYAKANGFTIEEVAE